MSERYVFEDLEVREGKKWLRLARGAIGGRKRLFLQCPVRHRQRAQRLPSALWHGQSRSWHVPFSAALVSAIENAFPREEFEYEWGEGSRDLWATARAWRDAQQYGNAATLPDIPINGSAWLHQRRAFHFARNLDATGLFIDMGGGKTLVTVGLLEEWEAKRVIVLCPKSVLGVWPREVSRWSLSPWKIWSAGSTRGTVIKKAHSLANWWVFNARDEGKVMLIVNYDSTWRDALAQFLLTIEWDVLVCDESHRIKSAGGVASKFAARLRRHCGRCLELTGTPTPHGPEDIYGQFRTLDPGIFGTNFARFRSKYFETKKINDKVEIIHYRNGFDGFRDEKAREDFQQKMRSISILIPREDMEAPGDGVDPSRRWTLPPVVREVGLETKTFKVYQSLKKELLAELDEDKVVVADNALTKLLRLRQITSGSVTVEDFVTGTRRTEQIGTEKRSLLVDVLGDIPQREPVVVFGVFHSDLDAIRWTCEEIGRDYLELSGRRRDGLAADSTLAGIGGEVVGVQLQSGGVGVDFTRSCYSVWFSFDYNLGNVKQARDRLDRPGQTRPITEIHLVAVTPVGGQTVDGLTVLALTERNLSNERVLEALRHGEL